MKRLNKTVPMMKKTINSIRHIQGWSTAPSLRIGFSKCRKSGRLAQVAGFGWKNHRSNSPFPHLDDGKISRKPRYLMVKTPCFPVHFPFNPSIDFLHSKHVQSKFKACSKHVQNIQLSGQDLLPETHEETQLLWPTKQQFLKVPATSVAVEGGTSMGIIVSPRRRPPWDYAARRCCSRFAGSWGRPQDASAVNTMILRNITKHTYIYIYIDSPYPVMCYRYVFPRHSIELGVYKMAWGTCYTCIVAFPPEYFSIKCSGDCL